MPTPIGSLTTGTPTTDDYIVFVDNADSTTKKSPISSLPSSGGDALTSNPLSQFASTTSAQLAGVISDETGSGSLVFANSPAIVTPTGIVKGDVGLGNVDNTSDATKNSATATLTNKTLTSSTNVIEEITTTASSATPTPTGGSLKNFFTVTALAAGATFGAPTGTPVNGNTIIMRVKDNGTARTLAYNAIYRAIGVTLPTTTVISKTMYFGMKYNSTDSKWDILAYGIES